MGWGGGHSDHDVFAVFPCIPIPAVLHATQTPCGCLLLTEDE